MTVPATDTVETRSMVFYKLRRKVSRNRHVYCFRFQSIHAKFVHNLKENKAHTNAPDQDQDQPQGKDIAEAAADKRQANRTTMTSLSAGRHQHHPLSPARTHTSHITHRTRLWLIARAPSGDIDQ